MALVFCVESLLLLSEQVEKAARVHSTFFRGHLVQRAEFDAQLDLASLGTSLGVAWTAAVHDRAASCTREASCLGCSHSWTHLLVCTRVCSLLVHSQEYVQY